MIGVMIVPTGCEAAIGGNAGDANPAAKLIASCCDKLITHPNVVNASDINEMTENTLYVEGSILDRFLCGEILLQEVKQNKILVIANSPIKEETINAVSAARVTIGVDAEILELKTPLRMIARIEDGFARGAVEGWEEAIGQVRGCDFDALAIHTPIELDRRIALNYYRNGGVNPWGWVEAKASKLIACELEKPVAHAPLENVSPEDEELFLIFQKVVKPQIAPEAISNCYLHSVLKGLHKAPRITNNITARNSISVKDVDFMITPHGCYGAPHRACLNAGIPMICVRENKTLEKHEPENFIYVENYWEAVGVIMCMKAGVTKESVRANICNTRVY